MNTEIDHYNQPHTVVLIFERPTTSQKSCNYEAEIALHASYYRNLEPLAKTVHYGEVMNDKAMCAIIQVTSAAAFENIIANDPGLKSGLYQIKQVVPFHQ